MATVLTNNGEEWAAERLAGVQGSGTNNVFANAGSHMGIGTGGAGAVKGDTALGTEVETRAVNSAATVTGTGSSAKYSVQGTVSITATRALIEAGLFSASSAGVMFVRGDFSVINLINGDSIQITVTIDPS